MKLGHHPPSDQFGQNANLCYIINLLHPALPTGFHSWTQVLTDWGVSGAFRQVGTPRCFKGRSELAAPFVAEISSAIREKQLFRRATRVALLQEQATEPAYDRAGGPAYVELRHAMEAAQERYIQVYRHSRSSAEIPATAKLATAHSEMECHQAKFMATRRAHEPSISATRAAIARDFWATQPTRGIPDTFFADAAAHATAARMQRLHPPWWGSFLGRLQLTLAHGHPAEGCLLDVLPRLRSEAKIKTFAAMVTEWREAYADQWGWYGKAHHRMLALRATRKADGVTAWFNSTAPGYLSDETVRYSLHKALQDCLTEADPWAIAAATSADYGIHGRN